MFMVHEKTVKEIFRAQDPKLQGKLRLDIRLGSVPPDADNPLDVRRARAAIGERLVHMVAGCSAEAVELGANDSRSRQGFLPDAVPPPPDAANHLLLMPDADTFERFVVSLINRIFGLDVKSRHYNSALRELAHDFNNWCQTDDARDDFVADKAHGRVFFICPCAQPKLAALEPADEVWKLSVDR
jgi:hypothetical protein